MLTITIHECAVRYGLSETDVRDFMELGLLHSSPDAPDALLDEPDQLTRLARLHYDLGLHKDSLEVVMAMRQQLLYLQQELARQRARVRQLENFLHGSAPLLDFD